MLKQTYFSISLLISLTSCRELSEADCLPSNSKFELSDSSIDIPRFKQGKRKGEVSYLYKYIKHTAEALNLDTLEHGYDSLQLRIWLGHSMAAKRNIVILKRKNQQWCAQVLTFSQDDLDILGKSKITFKNIRTATPRSSWAYFIDSIFRMKIISLPDDDELSEYYIHEADGISHIIEIATSNGYRLYDYHAIEENASRFWQAANVKNLANFLEKELEFEYTK